MRLLAVASKGGHWEQLCLLAPSFDGANVLFLTTDRRLAEKQGYSAYKEVRDFNQKQPVAAIIAFFEIWLVVREFKPDVVLSTGAAPGVWAVLFGRLVGAKTIWVDSIANAERLSLSGRIAKRYCNLVLSQWPAVATKHTCLYKGRVL